MNAAATPNESSRVARNAAVGALAAALCVGAWLLWWPVALGLAYGATSVILKPEVSGVKRALCAIGVAALITASGFVAGVVAVAVVGLICFVGFALYA